MAKASRVVHTVRIKHPSPDMGWFIDVEVLDAITIQGPDDSQTIYHVVAHSASAHIVDNTEAGVGADPFDATRVSHMEKITNPVDPTQSLFVEVLDAITLEGPNGNQICLQFQNDGSENISRAIHTEKIMNKGDPTKSQYATITYTDAITFEGPNNDQYMIYSQGNIATIDVTPDKDNPPKNKDPNPYIVWCPNKETGELTQGPWLGDALNSRIKPWQQGFFWWIKKIRLDQPWYFYNSKQQPLNFALERSDHSPDALLSSLIWVRVPQYSYVFEPLTGGTPSPAFPPIGFDSLEDAIDQQAIDMPENAYFIKFDFTSPFLFKITGFDFPDPANPKAKIPDFQKIVETFKKMWTDTSNTYNQIMQGCCGPAYGGVHFKQPTSSFKVPLGNPSIPTALGGIDDPHRDTDHFTAGVPPAYWLSEGSMNVFQPAYASYIEIGQLDPRKWNTTVNPPVRR